MTVLYERLIYFGIGSVFASWICWMVICAYSTDFEQEIRKQGELTLIQECQKNIVDLVPTFGIILARFPAIILLVAVSALFAWPLPLAMIVVSVVIGTATGVIAGIRGRFRDD